MQVECFCTRRTSLLQSMYPLPFRQFYNQGLLIFFCKKRCGSEAPPQELNEIFIFDFIAFPSGTSSMRYSIIAPEVVLNTSNGTAETLSPEGDWGRRIAYERNKPCLDETIFIESLFSLLVVFDLSCFEASSSWFFWSVSLNNMSINYGTETWRQTREAVFSQRCLFICSSLIRQCGYAIIRIHVDLCGNKVRNDMAR